MFELKKLTTSQSLWQRYRSLTLGRPVVKEQAYNAVYPWIDIDGIYYHRSLEVTLTLMLSGIPVPDTYKDDLDLINYIRYSVREEGQLRPTKYGMAAPENNAEYRKIILANEEELVFYGRVNLPYKTWSKPWIHSNIFNAGADMVKSDSECIKLSQKYPFICSPDSVDTAKFQGLGINWNNVWIWED